MNQKLRVLLFGTLLLGAFLLAGGLSSQVFAATSTNTSTPSFSRPFPNIQNYNRGYRDGLRACAERHFGFHAPFSSLHLTAYTRGYADGYAAGYNRGLHSCRGFDNGHHDNDRHGDNHQDNGNHGDNQAPKDLHDIKHP
jgi:hypothetical protein